MKIEKTNQFFRLMGKAQASGCDFEGKALEAIKNLVPKDDLETGLPLEYLLNDNKTLVREITDAIHQCGIQEITMGNYDDFLRLVLCD